ncbi:MAG: hypothetical protein HY541_04090 [Deltaproteobacteria bacterium]|nr:hypothetical protein [Deltaproteobacteria bacterium]
MSKGIDVARYQQAFIEPIEGTRFRGTVPEYDAQDFETLLLDLFWISVVYREEGESAAMSKLKDVGGEHYMREFSNFKGWQDVHRTDLVILLLRWISILEPELATPIKRDYPVLSSLEVPGDQTVHVPVQQDEIPKITAEDDNVVFIESGPDSEENPALGEVDPALGENSIKGSPAGRSIAGYTSGLFAPGRFVAPVPMAAARVRPVALAI